MPTRSLNGVSRFAIWLHLLEGFPADVALTERKCRIDIGSQAKSINLDDDNETIYNLMSEPGD